MIRRILTMIMVLAVLMTAAPAFAQTKIGFVNLQKALNQVEEGKKAKKKLKRELGKKQKALNKQQEKVKKMRSDFEAQAAMMNDAGKRKKVEELQKELMKLQKMYFSMQEDLSKAEARATKKIFEKMRGIVGKIAKEKGIDMVFEENAGVVYGKSSLDLTSEVIKRYNK